MFRLISSLIYCISYLDYITYCMSSLRTFDSSILREVHKMATNWEGGRVCLSVVRMLTIILIYINFEFGVYTRYVNRI